MTTFSLSAKTTRDWIKMALIPALCLTLAAIFCWPSQNDRARAAAKSKPSRSRPEVRRNTQPVPAKIKWPPTQLEDITAFNPFEPQSREPSPQTIVLPVTDQDPEIQHKTSAQPASVGKFQAICRGVHGAAAIFEGRIVRNGDLLPSGGRVVEISDGELTIETN